MAEVRGVIVRIRFRGLIQGNLYCNNRPKIVVVLSCSNETTPHFQPFQLLCLSTLCGIV
jgi:hypothetical protein